ncbi:MAG: Cys-tRNA(Pro) deacylase [Propionibacteriaceae bacterium]
MVKNSAQGATPALRVLEAAAIPMTLHSYDHDPNERHFGQETATLLGISPDRLFKTLIAATDLDRLVVAVIPVARQLDLKALAAATGSKRATMAQPALAQRATGYVVGGISPLGLKTRLPIFLDTCAFDHGTIVVSGGRRGLQVELNPTALQQVTSATLAQLTRHQ